MWGLQAERGLFCRPYPLAFQVGHGCVYKCWSIMCSCGVCVMGLGASFPLDAVGLKGSLAMGPARCNFQYSEAVCGVWARCGLCGRAVCKVCVQALTATKLIARNHYSAWLSAAVT